MKISRAILIPGVLLVYLVVMATMGWKHYAAGAMSWMEYYGVIALTLGIIVVLHFTIKRRDRLRRERLDDLEHRTREENNQSNISE